MGPQARYLPDQDGSGGRLHLQHGPIDLVIGADDGARLRCNAADMRARAFEVATARFETVLEELTSELPLLRTEADPDMSDPGGSVARRMVAAVKPLSRYRFITPMAAVAGAVAEEILDSMVAAFSPVERPARIYVNNGGDIAVHLHGDASFRVRIARLDNVSLGHFELKGACQSRGIATSGRGGRSLSLGIAESVTVIARTAAEADAAATLIANAVDLPGHPAIERVRAVDVRDDSDLGTRLVVRNCGRLASDEVEEALSRGGAEAERFIALGFIERAALFLQDQGRLAMACDQDSTGNTIIATEHVSHGRTKDQENPYGGGGNPP
ncbi:UPF0280 family protein [Rhizobium sp. SEMIA 4085]|nr:UPF0280 family protein [Rhizobium sp. SEMIA 4085]TDW19842.1 hypothetical protein EV128_12930 [Rhizobium azibense]